MNTIEVLTKISIQTFTLSSLFFTTIMEDITKMRKALACLGYILHVNLLVVTKESREGVNEHMNLL